MPEEETKSKKREKEWGFFGPPPKKSIPEMPSIVMYLINGLRNIKKESK